VLPGNELVPRGQRLVARRQAAEPFRRACLLPRSTDTKLRPHMPRIFLAACALGLCFAGTASAQAVSVSRARADRVEYGYPPPFEPAPASGIGAVVVGYAGLGISALQLATMPVCFADFYPDAAERACLISSLALAGIALSVGIPTLVVGLHRRQRYKAWRQRRLSSRQQLSGFGSRGGLTGGGLRYAVRF
jgi:hypothetical protein